MTPVAWGFGCFDVGRRIAWFFFLVASFYVFFVFNFM
jgi:hypothetical protein